MRAMSRRMHLWQELRNNMRSAFLVAAGSAALACGISSSVAAPPHGAQCATVPLDLSGPRPAVTLTSADGTSVPAIIDTGAINTTLNIEFAEQLGVTNEGSLAPPFDRHSTGYQTTLKGARLGSLELPDRSVPVMPSPLPDKAAVPRWRNW
jgi:hypothetical protein